MKIVFSFVLLLSGVVSQPASGSGLARPDEYLRTIAARPQGGTRGQSDRRDGTRDAGKGCFHHGGFNSSSGENDSCGRESNERLRATSPGVLTSWIPHGMVPSLEAPWPWAWWRRDQIGCTGSCDQAGSWFLGIATLVPIGIGFGGAIDSRINRTIYEGGPRKSPVVITPWIERDREGVLARVLF